MLSYPLLFGESKCDKFFTCMLQFMFSFISRWFVTCVTCVYHARSRPGLFTVVQITKFCARPRDFSCCLACVFLHCFGENVRRVPVLREECWRIGLSKRLVCFLTMKKCHLHWGTLVRDLVLTWVTNVAKGAHCTMKIT